MRRGLAFFILLAAAVTGLVWSIRAVFPRSVQEVEAVRVRRGTLEITLPVTGIFETRTADLAFEAPGRLADVPVVEGGSVRAGALVAAVEADELRAGLAQAEDARQAAGREAERVQASVDAARRQRDQAEFAYRAARATLAQVEAGPRPGELAQVQAAVDAARAALEEARRTLERTEQLVRDGALGQAQLDAARSQLGTAEARYRQAVAQRDLLRAGAALEAVEAAREQVHQALAAREAAAANVRQAEAAAGVAQAHVRQAGSGVDAARARLSRAELRAPFDGTITRVYLNPGSPVGPGVPVASLSAPGGWVTADIDEADIGQVRIGQVARVTADAYPGRTFPGRVARIGRQVEVRLGARVVRARIDLDGRVGMRVGTGVDVQVVERSIPDVLLAPAEAVIAVGDGGPHLFLVENGILHRRDVRTGGSNDEFVAILDGVREGELVAVAEPDRLREGLRVRVTGER